MGTPKAAKASPAATESALDIVEEGRKKRREMQKLQGFQSTLVAGNPERQGSTLLGGGQ